MLVAAALFLVCILLIKFTLPSVPRAAPLIQSGGMPLSGWRDRNVRLLFIASVTMWTCNTMYIIGMPLYISATLGPRRPCRGTLCSSAHSTHVLALVLSGS